MSGVKRIDDSSLIKGFRGRQAKLLDQVRQLCAGTQGRSYDEEIQQEETDNAEIQYRSRLCSLCLLL